MAVCVPIKDMRDTVKFSELIESAPGPVTVTKNGYDQFVVMRSDDYEAIRLSEAKARLMARMALAERERAQGTAVDALESLDRIEAKYGL